MLLDSVKWLSSGGIYITREIKTKETTIQRGSYIISFYKINKLQGDCNHTEQSNNNNEPMIVAIQPLIWGETMSNTLYDTTTNVFPAAIIIYNIN